jgi:hypothetical protein
MLSRIEFFFAHIDYDQNDVKKTPIEWVQINLFKITLWSSWIGG